MATYQVRIDADGEKILSEPLSGLEGSLATEEAPGVVQPDGKTVRVDNTGVLSAIGGNLLLNSEEWITESGTWTAPVTGWYEVLCINGGFAGAAAGTYVIGGHGGARATRLMQLSAGQQIPVIIGVGGTSSSINGGATSFGDFSPVWEKRFLGGTNSFSSGSTSYDIGTCGGGEGGGAWNWDVATDPSATSLNGHWYGGGGGARNLVVTVSGISPGIYTGNGYQGAIRLRFYDPAKAAGPTE